MSCVQDTLQCLSEILEQICGQAHSLGRSVRASPLPPSLLPHPLGRAPLSHLTLCQAILFLKYIINFINFDVWEIYVFLNPA